MVRFVDPIFLSKSNGEKIYYSKFKSFDVDGVDVDIIDDRLSIDRYSMLKDVFNKDADSSNRTIDIIYLFSQLIGGGLNYDSFLDIFTSSRHVGEILGGVNEKNEQPKIGIHNHLTGNAVTEVRGFDGKFEGFLPKRGCYMEGRDIFNGKRKSGKFEKETEYEKYKKYEVLSFNRLRTPLKREAGVEYKYSEFGGVLFYDIDSKDRNTAIILKQKLHDLLSDYSQYYGIRYSTSGDGVHIYFVIKSFDEIWEKVEGLGNEYISFDESEKEYIYRFYFDYCATRFGFAINEALLALMHSGEVTNFIDVDKKEDLVKTFVNNPANLKKLVDRVSYEYSRMLLISNDRQPFFNPNFKHINGFGGHNVGDNCENSNLYEDQYIDWVDNVRGDKSWLFQRNDILYFFATKEYINETNKKKSKVTLSLDDFSVNNPNVAIDSGNLYMIASKVARICNNVGLDNVPYDQVRLERLLDDYGTGSNVNNFYVRRWVIPKVIHDFYSDVYDDHTICALAAAACNKVGHEKEFDGFLKSSIRRAFLNESGGNSRSVIEYLNYVLSDYFSVSLKKGAMDKISEVNKENIITAINTLPKRKSSLNSIYQNDALKTGVNKVIDVGLGENDYLSEKLEEIMNHMTENGIYLWDSQTGSGKTVATQEIAKQFKSLLFSPFKALQENHYNGQKEFFIVNGKRSFDDVPENVTAVLTYDKARQVGAREIEKFKCVFVDESHIMGASSYRAEAVNGLIDLLIKFSKHTKVILTTATPMMESLIFEKTKINILKVHKKDKREKTAKFELYNTKKDCDIALVEHIYDKVIENRNENNNHRNVCIVASNQGDNHVNSAIIKPVNDMLIEEGYEPLKGTYYCTDKKMEEINQKITDFGDMDNTELIVGTTLIINGLNIYLKNTLDKNPKLSEIRPYYYAYLPTPKGSPKQLSNRISSFTPHDLMQIGSRTRDAKTIDLTILFPNQTAKGDVYDHGIDSKFTFEHPVLNDDVTLRCSVEIYNIGVKTGDTKNALSNAIKGFFADGSLIRNEEGMASIPEFTPLSYIENNAVMHYCKPWVVAEFLKNEYGFKVEAIDCTEIDSSAEIEQNIKDNKKSFKELKKENAMKDYLDIVELIKVGHPINQIYKAFMDDKANSVQVLKNPDDNIIVEKSAIYLRVADSIAILKLASFLLGVLKTKHDVLDFFDIERFVNKSGNIMYKKFKKWYLLVYYKYGEYKKTNGEVWVDFLNIKNIFDSVEGYTKPEIDGMTMTYAKHLVTKYFDLYRGGRTYKDMFGTNKSLAMHIKEIIESFMVTKETGFKNGRSKLYDVRINDEVFDFKEIVEYSFEEKYVECRIFSELFEKESKEGNLPF